MNVILLNQTSPNFLMTIFAAITLQLSQLLPTLMCLVFRYHMKSLIILQSCLAMLGFKSCCMAILSTFIQNLESTRKCFLLWLKSYNQWDMRILKMWPFRNSWKFFFIYLSQAYPYVMLESDSSMQSNNFQVSITIIIDEILMIR